MNDSIEKGSRFVAAKAQVVRVQFGQLPAGAQARQPQDRIGAGGQAQVHLWRQMVEQKGERLVNRRGLDHVVIVEDEHQAIRKARDLVEQSGQDRFDVDLSGRLKRAQ